jgi:hypothetical protein
MNIEFINIEVSLRERALRMEARKLSIESLVKVHLESVTGTRQLVLAHQRLMFTLSLGALAGVITLFAAALRLGGPGLLPLPTLSAVLASFSLVSLTASALISAATLQIATQKASRFLREPFPGAAEDLYRLFASGSSDETQIVSGVLDVLERRVKAEPVIQPRTFLTTFLLLSGVASAAASFAF